jgi:hypothetical protein
MDLGPVENILDRKSDDKLEQNGTKARTSGRCRKYPVTRRDDILWSTGLSKRVI